MPRETGTAKVLFSGADTPPLPKRVPKTGRTAKKHRSPRTPVTVPLAARDGVPLGYRLMAAAHVYSTALGKALRSHTPTRHLTVPQLQTLQLLNTSPGTCGADLARALGVQPQTMTSISSTLVAQGLIAPVGGVGRTVDLELTGTGSAMLRAALAVAEDVNKRLDAAYSYDGAEAAALAKLLELGRLAFTATPAAPAADDDAEAKAA